MTASCVSLASAAESSAPLLPEVIDFNQHIRPLLSDKCFYCHGQDGNQRKADLRLDRREAAVEYGAIVPGDPDGSLLIERTHATDPEMVMPPPSSNRFLSDRDRDLLRRWIAEGAEYQTHWAFVAPQRPALPAIANASWVRNEIDDFVLHALEREGMQPSPEADRRTLIKRLCIDLVGLPPTPDEVAAFVNDRSPKAYENLVDRLLHSPHYGERMALPWLEAARYADSNGFQQDGDTWQWIWRDWLVRALNEDLPFDQFTIWQLAGDLLPDATQEQKIASAFNRNHMLNGEGGAIAEEQRFNILFDRIDTTSTTWLGLTLACAQCHDHKYDPLTQREYYQLLDAFNRVPEKGMPQRYSARIRLDAPVMELPTDENRARLAAFDREIAAIEEQLAPKREAAYQGWLLGITREGEPGWQVLSAQDEWAGEAWTALFQKPEAEWTDPERARVDAALREYFRDAIQPSLAGNLPELKTLRDRRQARAAYEKDQIPRLMIMSDARPRTSHVLDRGQYLSPQGAVDFDVPECLPPLPEAAPRNRLGLARWLVAPEHPLTARVQVNRIWQHFFGVGLVKTSEDFGVQSAYPRHRDLLDWLAVEFRESGWQVKALQRKILLSATYRQSSRVGTQQRQGDPENVLLGRSRRFRMPSMVLRDWALAAAGLLVRDVGGPPVYPYQPDRVWEPLQITKERDFTYPASQGEDLYRRSLYTFWRRTVAPANMFDATNRQTCRVRPSITSTPLHALTTLNDPTWVEAARHLAAHACQTSPQLEHRIRDMFTRVLCRPPTRFEASRLADAWRQQRQLYEDDTSAAVALLQVGASPNADGLDLVDHAAMTAIALGILNLDEALTRE